MNAVSAPRSYILSIAAVIVCTVICSLIDPHIERANLVMIYLLGTLAVAARGSRGPAALSSALSVLAFDFFFVPPRFKLRVSDTQYLLTFVVMFSVAMIISHLTIRLREQVEAAREGERRTTYLMEKAKKAEIDAETEHLRSSLLSAVSHDFRTPLAAIVGSAEALRGKESLAKDNDALELLDNIQMEGERLSHLVKNLLEATRLESKGVHIHKELYPLEEIVGSALGRVEKTLAGRPVEVYLPDELPSVPLDALLVEQVLINLLENADRYSPRGQPLQVSARLNGRAVEIAVSDRGSGLLPEELERVFDKFFRGESSKGSGLGLAICRAVVEGHQGRIWAENQPGGGAVFTFSLPLESPVG